MLTVSLNEVYSETYKALRSVGIEWGLVKDCANLSRWLVNHDYYFLGSVLKTADLYKENKLSTSIKDNNLKKPLTSALMGLLLVEYVSANKVIWKGYLHSPKFLLASMGLIAQEQNISLVLKNSKNSIIAYTNDQKLYINTNFFNNLTGYFFLETCEFKKNCNQLSLVQNQKLEISKINKKCWDRLSSMAFETYVPESEASKSGAGY